MKKDLICPDCESQQIRKHSFYKRKSGWIRRFKCKKCSRTFSESYIVDKKLDHQTEQQNHTSVQMSSKKKQQMKQRAKKKLLSIFPEKGQVKYSQEEIIEVLLRIALNNQFISGGTEQYKQQQAKKEVPGKNTVYKRLKELKPQKVIQALDEVCKMTCKKLKQQNVLNKPVDVAIDEHDWRFYGEADAEGVTRTKPDRGTSKAYKFLTICIVSGETRITLGVVPLKETKVIPVLKGVKKLVKKARKRVNIRFLYADRGFYMAPVIDWLKRQVPFFIRAKVSKKMKRNFRRSPKECYVGEYTVKRKRGEPYVQTEVTLVVKENEEGEKVGFVTNRSVNRKKGKKFIKTYRSRWGIETSYRMIRKFLVRTTSKKHQIRIGLFVMAVLLYNSWLYENVIYPGRQRIKVVIFAGIIKKAVNGKQKQMKKPYG